MRTQEKNIFRNKQVFKDKDTFWAIVNPCGGWALCYGNAGDINNGLESAERFDTPSEAREAIKADGYDSACRICKVEITTKVTY